MTGVEEFLASIDISCRDDKNGSSAFFDHYAIQKTTNHPTQAIGVFHRGQKFVNVIKSTPFNLPRSELDSDTLRATPPFLANDEYLNDENDRHCSYREGS